MAGDYSKVMWQAAADELKIVIQDTESELQANPGEDVLMTLQQNFGTAYDEY